MARFINGRLVWTEAEMNDPEESKTTLIALVAPPKDYDQIDVSQWGLRVSGLEPEAGPICEWIEDEDDEV